MDTSPAALFVGFLIGDHVSDEKGVSRERIDELTNGPDSGRVKRVVLPKGDSPDSGNAACAPSGKKAHVLNGTSVGATHGESESKHGTGKPEGENSFSVYTYSVRRVH